MKTSAIHVASVLLLGMLLPVCRAQDKPKPEEKPKGEVSTTPVKALIVFTEYDGDRKIKSLPYTLYINAPDASDWRGPGTKLRRRNRAAGYHGEGPLRYFDGGTNIYPRGA